MSKALVIVESPAKARTISRFLGKDFQVEASIGHVRDLPTSAADIPASVKDKAWARIGVDVEHDFAPLYIIPSSKKSQVSKLKQAMKGAHTVYLATDEDREGEAIAWHLLEILKPKVPVRRMVFHEITDRAIQKALENPRDLDMKLVDAQEARRILDRLYGYELSPVLWRKIKPRLSAGRVQSVATRLVVDRERGRMRFVSASFWDVGATLLPQGAGEDGKKVGCRLFELDGKKLATGKDFDPSTGQLSKPDSVFVLDEERAKAVAGILEGETFQVVDVQEKPFTQRPSAPFITSSLQQEAARKLRFSPQNTMRVAQSLYENGYITYMRTDSTNLSGQALNAARSQVKELYGSEYLPASPRVYTRKAKGAQEAHEAIRPAGDSFRTPESLRGELSDAEQKLYDLIWKRTVASQMNDAQGQRTSVVIEAEAGEHGKALFSASGRVITFPGFLRAYVEGSDDPEAELGDQEKVLPRLSRGDRLDPREIEAKGHSTQPPARYTEASLIKELEDRGIGRPSTYASIIQTIQDRGYVWKKGTALIPSFTAFAVVNLLEQHFGELVDYTFTAKMEEALDAVAAGEREATPWLRDFYFGTGEDGADDFTAVGLKVRIGTEGEEIDPREVCAIPMGEDEDGQPIFIRVGRYGPYLQVADSDLRANLPEGLAPDELDKNTIQELIKSSEQGDREVGKDPETGKTIYAKTGRFGPYVQLGELESENGADASAAETANGKKKPAKKSTRKVKPKMASLFPWMKPETVTLEEALQVLSFPKEVGVHPRTGEVMVAQDGRFGPYLKMGTETRSLKDHQHLVSVSAEEAAKLFDEPKQGRRQSSPKTLAELGEAPGREGNIQILNGRFGPYVTDGVVNASLPKGRDPASFELADAVALLEAREQYLRDQGKDPRAKAAKKSAAKKPAVKKTAAKKTAAKKTTAAAKKSSAAKPKAASKTASKSATKTKTAAKKSESKTRSAAEDVASP